MPHDVDVLLTGDPDEVAPRLLGCHLTDGVVTVRLTEVVDLQNGL